MEEHEQHDQQQHGTAPDAVSRLRDVETFVRRHVAKNYSNWAHDRDDLVGIVLEKYSKKWGRGPGPDQLKSWLRVVIKNAASDVHDARAKELGNKAFPEDDDSMMSELFAQLRSPSVLPVLNDVWGRALALIDPDDRAVLRLTYFEGLPAAGVARKLDIGVVAAAKRIQRARKSFRATLEREPALLAELRGPHPRAY